ncbi:MAG: hypothetical protein LBH25_06580 [Fibromonadaceae bacterium]|jgi:uncharacterized protein YbaR (Trm112 family)|nr:hypothetical protein [Fibromonadaceae bacterium]
MLSKELLEILCCPITKQALQEATAVELEKTNSSLAKAGKEKLDAALITADKKHAYPIRNQVPVLLAEERIAIDD